MAKVVTKPVIVTLENMLYLTKCVTNGPIYPGADHLFCRGVHIVQLEQPSILTDIKVGDIVARHTITGDIVVYRDVECIVEIDPKRKGDMAISLYIPPANCDFDGSECDFD